MTETCPNLVQCVSLSGSPTASWFRPAFLYHSLPLRRRRQVLQLRYWFAMQLSYRDSKCCIASLFGTPRKSDAWFRLYHPVPWRFLVGHTKQVPCHFWSPDHLHCLCETKVPCWLRSNRTVPVLLWVIDATQQFSMFAQLDLCWLPNSSVTATCNEAGFLRSGWIELHMVCSSRFAKQPESNRSFHQIAVMQESHFVHYIVIWNVVLVPRCWLSSQKVWTVYHWNYLGINGHLDMAQH